MKTQRFIHVVLSLVLFGGMALLGILGAVFANLVSNFIQVQTSYRAETLFFFITMISIAIFIVLIIGIFRYLYLQGSINGDWAELIGKAVLIGTTSLSLTVFFVYYYQNLAGQGLTAQAFFYFLIAFIPLVVAIGCYEWLWSSTLRIQARVYQILDDQLEKSSRVEEGLIKDQYLAKYQGDSSVLAASIRWAMAQYVIEKSDLEIIPGDPYLALEGNRDVWAVVKNEPVKVAKVVDGVPVEMSREDQQWVFMGKWLSTRDEIYYFLLVGLAKEPDGLLPGVWDNLKLRLDHVRTLAIQNGKLDPEDALLEARLEGLMSLKSAANSQPLTPAATVPGDKQFELNEQQNLADNWLNRGSRTAYASLLLKARSKDGLLPEIWQTIGGCQADLRKKFIIYQNFSPQERETFKNIEEILQEKI